MKIPTLLVLATSIALAAVPAHAEESNQTAGPARMGRPGGMAGLAGQLKLTDAQRAQFRERAFAAAHRAVQTRSKLAEARITMHELMSAEKLDEAAVRAQARVVGDLQGQAVREGIDRRLDMLSVLTPEQRKLARDSMHRGGWGGAPLMRMRMHRRHGGPGMGEMDSQDGPPMEVFGGIHGTAPGMHAPGTTGSDPSSPGMGEEDDIDFLDFDPDSPGEDELQ